MSNVLKITQPVNIEALNQYITLVGLAPISFYNLLLNEKLEYKDIISTYQIPQFEAEEYLVQLQGAKLIQVIMKNEKIFYKLIEPINLPKKREEKITTISNHLLNIKCDANLSKTTGDVFGTILKNENFKKPWTEFFEATFNAKIDSTTLMQLMQLQEQLTLVDEVINTALYKTLSVCNKFNANYLTKCLKTLSKLKIQNANAANQFFSGELFYSNEEEQKLSLQLKQELENMEW